MRKYRFYKDELGWFIDLKWFPFNRAWLAMVEGADKLLDKLSEGKDEVTLLVDTSPFPYTDGWLQKEVGLGLKYGVIYNVRGIEIDHTFNTQQWIQSQLWLCPATLWVFLKYPEKIYYKVDRTKIEEKKKRELFNLNWLFGQNNELGNLSTV